MKVINLENGKTRTVLEPFTFNNFWHLIYSFKITLHLTQSPLNLGFLVARSNKHRLNKEAR